MKKKFIVRMDIVVTAWDENDARDTIWEQIHVGKDRDIHLHSRKTRIRTVKEITRDGK